MILKLLNIIVILYATSVLAQEPNKQIQLAESDIANHIDFEYELSYDIIPKKQKGFKKYLAKFKKKPNLVVSLNLPQSIPGLQEITNISFTPTPTRLFSENGNKYAEFIMPMLKSKKQITVHAEGTVYKNDLSLALQKNKHVLLTDSELAPYLKHERLIEKDSSLIQKLASRLEGETEIEIVENIFSYVIKKINPDLSKAKGAGALKTIQIGRGKCIDVSDVFVALCRARGIPARVAAGFKMKYSTTPKHAWVEVYFEQHGWVPFDVSFAYIPTDENLECFFRNSRNHYLKFTDLRSDPVLKNCYYYCYPYWDKQLRECILPISEKIIFVKPKHKTTQ